MVQRFPGPLLLAADSLHVVACRLDIAVPDAIKVLDVAERERAARFVFERDRRRYINAHAQLRIILGRCLERPPESLRFASTSHGKPYLAEGARKEVQFNLSHAGERALVAITVGRKVGVDIEQECQLHDLADMAHRFFAPAEIAALRALPVAEQTAAFFRCWTRKESFVKALGDGLSYPLAHFEVSLDPEPWREALRGCASDPDVSEKWRIVAIPVEPGYVAAVAAQTGDWRLKLWHADLVSLSRFFASALGCDDRTLILPATRNEEDARWTGGGRRRD